MDTKEKQPVFATKRARISYQQEHPPKVCPTCLRGFSTFEKEEGVFVEWCFFCNSSVMKGGYGPG